MTGRLRVPKLQTRSHHLSNRVPMITCGQIPTCGRSIPLRLFVPCRYHHPSKSGTAVTGTAIAQNTQNCLSMNNRSSFAPEVSNSASKKGPLKMAAIVFVGKKTMVMIAIMTMRLESRPILLESFCVTRLKERLMSPLMRLSSPLRRRLVEWIAVWL